MSGSIPISHLSPSKVASVNSNETNQHHSNSVITNLCSEDVPVEDTPVQPHATYPQNIYKKFTIQTYDSCNHDISLLVSETNTDTINLNDENINSLGNDGSHGGAKMENKNLDRWCDQKLEVATAKNNNDSKHFLQGKELISGIAQEKLGPSKDLHCNVNALNGDIFEKMPRESEANCLIEKSSNNEEHSLQPTEVCNRESTKDASKHLNGIRESISSKNFENIISVTNACKGDNILKNYVELYEDSATIHAQDKLSSHITSPSSCLINKHLLNSNISNQFHHESRDRLLPKANRCDSLPEEMDHLGSNVNKDEVYSLSNGEIRETNLQLVLPQNKNLQANDISNCHSNTENYHFSTVKISSEMCADSSDNEISAINSTVSIDNHFCSKIGLSQVQITERAAPQNSINVSQSVCEVEMNLSTVEPSEHKGSIYSSNAEKTITNLGYVKDILPEQIYPSSREDINLCIGNSNQCRSEKDAKHLENFCIICKKEVEHLYYHVAKDHCCLAFIPVKYMKNYQEHLYERSPSMNEHYMQSLHGDEILKYICKNCGMLLKSIECVRIHLNIHSSIYAVHYSKLDCSCNMNYKYNIHYFISYLLHSDYECFLCHQLTSCKSSLYKHLKAVHFNKNFCQECSMVLGDNSSDIFDHNLTHSAKIEEIGDVHKDCSNFSWNVLNNNLNSLDGTEYQLKLKGNSSECRAFSFPIEINLVRELAPANAYISPTALMKKYLDSKFMWKRSLHAVSNYAALSFDVLIQKILSKKLLSVKKKTLPHKKSQHFLASLGLKQLCRSSKRNCANDAKSSSKMSSDEGSSSENTSEKVELNDDVVKISGEWGNTHIFMCCSCGTSFDCLTDVMDHKWLEHPGVWCAHTMLRGNEEVSLMFSQQYLPSTNLPFVKEATPKEFHSKRESAHVKCTKCKKSISISQFCSHAVECGDLNQLTAKKKFKKTMKLQSHKGQRMSSRYAPAQRNSYKDMEEDTKMSSSDILSSNRLSLKLSTIAKKADIVTAQSKRANLKPKGKAMPLPPLKSKKATKLKKGKFNMKLRRQLNVNSKKSIRNIVPNVVKVKSQSTKGKYKLPKMKLPKKVIVTESVVKKPSKIIKKKSHLRSAKNSSINKIAEVLKVCKAPSKEFDDKKVTLKSVKKEPKPKSDSFGGAKQISDFEDDFSDEDAKSISPMKRRREGLRTRQQKIKKTGYSLRKKSNPSFSDAETNTMKDSPKVASLTESQKSGVAKDQTLSATIKETKSSIVKEVVNVRTKKKPKKAACSRKLRKCSGVKKSLKTIRANVPSNMHNRSIQLETTTGNVYSKAGIAKRLLKGGGAKLSKKARGKIPLKANRAKRAVKTYITKEAVKADITNEAVKADITNETVKADIANETVKAGIAKDAVKVDMIKEKARTDTASDAVKTEGIEDTIKTDMPKETLVIDGKRGRLKSGNVKKSFNIIRKNRGKKSQKHPSTKGPTAANIESNPVDASIANETKEAAVAKDLQNGSISEQSLQAVDTGKSLSDNRKPTKITPATGKIGKSRTSIVNKVNCLIKKRKNPDRNPEELLGFPVKKRKYNIEDESDVIGHMSKENVKSSHAKAKRNSKRIKKQRVSSFGKFLKSFKEKSQHLSNLARSKKFSDFKLLYKLTKRKVSSKSTKTDKNTLTLTSTLKKPIRESHIKRSHRAINTKSKGRSDKKSMYIFKKKYTSINEKTAKQSSRKKVQRKKVKKTAIVKCKPKVGGEGKKSKRKTKYDVKFTEEVGPPISETVLEEENSGDKLTNHNSELVVEEDALVDTIINIGEKLAPKQDSSNSVITFSSNSANCNASCKVDPVNGRKRKSFSKENRFSCKKRKAELKESLTELPLQADLFCNDCGLRFDSASSKEDHVLDCRNIAFEMSIMADEKLFECPHCQLTFAKAGTKKKHTASCRPGRHRKSQKLNSRVVKTDMQHVDETLVAVLTNDSKVEDTSGNETLPDLNNIAERFKNHCLSHTTAPQVCSVLYSCTLSTPELRNCLCESISLDNSTIVQPKSDDTSTNKNNFTTLKSLLDQRECSDFVNVLYEVMVSIKANSYLKMKDMDNSPLKKAEIPPILIEASRSDLLKALSGIEDFLKEAEELESSVQKEEMLRSMKLAFEAGTCS